MNPSTSNPLGVGTKLVNLSQGVTSAPINALPVFVFVDEFQALMSAPVVSLSTRQSVPNEVIL